MIRITSTRINRSLLREHVRSVHSLCDHGQMLPALDTFRPYALDGAQLYFHPPTGTTIRIENESTRALRTES